MLDTTSKQILAFLRPFALDDPDGNVSMDLITIGLNLPSLSPGQIRAALDFLDTEGYLNLVKSVGGRCSVFNLTHKGINYKEFDIQPVAPSQNITIGTVNNSAIGNNGDTTINNDLSIEQIRSLISSKPAEDQKDLNSVVDTVAVITENSETVSKGFLSKFSDLLAKHSDIAIALGNSIMTWLTTK